MGRGHAWGRHDLDLAQPVVTAAGDDPRRHLLINPISDVHPNTGSIPSRGRRRETQPR